VKDSNYAFKWSKKPKAAVAQMISQAWDRHCRDREAVSKDRYEVFSVMMEQWNKEVQDGMNETFVAQLQLGHDKMDFSAAQHPFVTEVYTDTEPIAVEARRRGLRASNSLTLGTGWNFLEASDRARAIKWIKFNKPYLVVLAFPCNPWSVLLNLNANVDVQRLRDEALVLVEFAIEVALLQLNAGRHFLLENPLTSAAWKLDVMLRFLQDPRVRSVVVDMCRFGLCNSDGALHRKPTKLVSSSQALMSALIGKRCTGDHAHAAVMGGAKVTRPAGHYTKSFAKVVVSAFQDQFDHETALLHAHDVLVAEDIEVPRIEEDPLSSGDDAQVPPEIGNVKIPASIRSAVQRLHINTGHRSGRRLARALVLCGAPKEAVMAARNLTCAVCDERKAPKARRPATLPSVSDVGAQVHVDILMVEDAFKQVYTVFHATDKVSRYQLAGLIPNKSTNAVISFLTLHWIPLLGVPQIIIADQGREFISQEFEEWCGSRSIFLHHIGVQCPWQNGISERSGATLKALVGALVRTHSLGGADEMKLGVAEAVAAYNSDVNEEGVSPLQAVTGRQQPAQGDVLAGVGNRLAEHSLLENKPSLARQVALRETARVAMVRMHFSRSLRRAELARARSTTLADVPQPGDLCYFWRASKYNPRRKDQSTNSRRKLDLRRWFGPAMMVALENGKDGGVGANAFLSFRGQLTKCGLEHVRKASSLEQISFDAWEEAVRDVIQAAEAPVPLDVPGARDDEVDDGFGDHDGLAETPFPVRPLGLGDGLMPGSAPGDTAELVPPLTLPEVVAAIQPPHGLGSSQATSIAPTPTTPLSQCSAAYRRPPETTAQPGTPVGDLLDNVNRPTPLQAPIERARALQQPASPRPPGEKRAASQEPARPSDAARGSDQVVIDVDAPQPAFEALQLSWEQLCNVAGDTSTHPLIRLQAEAEQDRRAPLDNEEYDHGSWDGRWAFLCEKDWKLMQELGEMFPTGSSHEALNVQASRKEYNWNQLSPEDRKGFADAAVQGWQVYFDNGALEVLDMKTSGEIRRQLAKDGALDKILQPRFVLTDKHDGLRTEDHWLPRKYSARLVVPGFRDRCNLEGRLRRDAPTGCRISQHLLFCIGACHPLWKLLSGDIKSAFMKGDIFQDESRILFICGTDPKVSPPVPLKPGQIAKVKKAVFGLADAPREWWLKLSRILTENGWESLVIDGAAWLLWDAAVEVSARNFSHLKGMIVAHVDDLLFIGDPDAVQSFDHVGKLLGFGSREETNFVWCGKRIRRAEDKTIRVSMNEYHQNLKEIYISRSRRNEPHADLTAAENRQLKALLGSFQWLVAQLRFDMSFVVSSLQGEKPTVATMLKANSALREFQKDCGFEMVFKPVNLATCGILVVCDAALGNVNKEGCADDAVLNKVFSQAGYFVLIADSNLMSGKLGCFNILDARSHRIPRVCRSTYAAELLSTEEAFDVGILCRGFLASVRGFDLSGRFNEPALGMIDLQVVVDAKDVHDKSNSDTSTYGAQKSMAFTVSWMRSQLRKPRTSLKWTSTENMWVDGMTKAMDLTHLRKIMTSGEWSVSYCPKFVKQVYKSAKKKVQIASSTQELPGEPMMPNDPLMNHLMKLAEHRGWHFQNNIGVHVAFHAKSFRTPEPRFSAEAFPCRSSFARFGLKTGQYEWRQLEKAVKYSGLANQHALFGASAPVLITLFHKGHESSLSDCSATNKI
jgi:transposase InsO family protein